MPSTIEGYAQNISFRDLDKLESGEVEQIVIHEPGSPDLIVTKNSGHHTDSYAENGQEITNLRPSMEPGQPKWFQRVGTGALFKVQERTR